MCLIWEHYNKRCNEYDHRLSHLRLNVYMAKSVINMASNEKVLNMKNFRLVKMNNFDFWTIFIRGRMQPVQPKPCSLAKTPFAECDTR